ncbi:hypothetical protein BGW80DRAFT_1447618 [Lactifluus volemus]|nr:hypothetical protein BGW80DRAFT_1447618 [Lactifluus volemus]
MQVNATTKFCRNGTRDECPIEKCRFQHARPTFLYSSAAKASLPPPTTPTPVNTPTANGFQAKPCRYGTRNNCPNEKCRFQHAEPALPLVTQHQTLVPESTPDGLACFRSWLEGQVVEQKAKIQACAHNTLSQFRTSTPATSGYTNDTPPMWNAFLTNAVASNAHGSAVQVPACTTCPGFVATQDAQRPYRQPDPTYLAGAQIPHNNQGDQASISTNPAAAVVNYPHGAPKKAQLAYKTPVPALHPEPIHDPDLEWVSVPDRSSGRSTPSSMTLVGSKSAVPGKTFVESEADTSRSGLCPHADEGCRYVHPTDILPYIKYTPCLTWPRCGYPTQACPLKHPQVDKLPMPIQQLEQKLFTTPNVTTVIPQPQTSVPRAAAYADIPPLQQHQQPVPSVLAPAKEAIIIPHDQAYASAVRNHRPTAPSAEMFRPPPPTPIVRLRHPSGVPPTPRMAAAQNQVALPRVPRLEVYAGRARRAGCRLCCRDGVKVAGEGVCEGSYEGQELECLIYPKNTVGSFGYIRWGYRCKESRRVTMATLAFPFILRCHGGLDII